MGKIDLVVNRYCSDTERFADYPFRLLCVNEMDEFSMFHTQLQDVFRLMQCRKDKEKVL